MDQERIQQIRKSASIEAGRRFLTGEDDRPLPVHALTSLELVKVGHAYDPELFATASVLRPLDPFSLYEEMGGRYKVAKMAPLEPDLAENLAAIQAQSAPVVPAPAPKPQVAGPVLPMKNLPGSRWAALTSAKNPRELGGEHADLGGVMAQGALHDVAAPKSGLGRGVELLTGGHQRALEGAEQNLLGHAGGVVPERMPAFQEHAKTVSGAIENEAANVARARRVAGGVLGGLGVAGGAAAAGVMHHQAAQEAARKALMTKGLLGAGALGAGALAAHHFLGNKEEQHPGHAQVQ